MKQNNIPLGQDISNFKYQSFQRQDAAYQKKTFFKGGHHKY